MSTWLKSCITKWYDKESRHSLTGGQCGNWKIQEKLVQHRLEAKLKCILILNTSICSPWLPPCPSYYFLSSRKYLVITILITASPNQQVKLWQTLTTLNKCYSWHNLGGDHEVFRGKSVRGTNLSQLIKWQV